MTPYHAAAEQLIARSNAPEIVGPYTPIAWHMTPDGWIFFATTVS